MEVWFMFLMGEIQKAAMIHMFGDGCHNLSPMFKECTW